MTEVVKFNIGGTRYEVSRSLLNQYPESMLAKSSSGRWQKEQSSEIFIERDGQRFRYILDYLRDGLTILPLYIAKDAVMADLSYYGVENVNWDAIKDRDEQESHIAKKTKNAIDWFSICQNESSSLNKEVATLDETIVALKGQRKTLFFAKKCIDNFMQNAHSDCRFDFCISAADDEDFYEAGRVVYNNNRSKTKKFDRIKDVNTILSKIGLHLKAIKSYKEHHKSYFKVSLTLAKPDPGDIQAIYIHSKATK